MKHARPLSREVAAYSRHVAAADSTSAVGKTRCVFCNSTGKITREHVLPQWMKEHEHFRGRDEVMRTKEYITQPIGPVFDSTQNDVPIHLTNDYRLTRLPSEGGDILDRTVKRVCAACNNGWMSALEGRAKDTLLRLMLGRKVILRGKRLDSLVMWSIKTALMRQLTSPRLQTAPEELFHEFYRRGAAPETMGVGLAHADRKEYLRTDQQVHHLSGGRGSGGLTVLALGKMLLVITQVPSGFPPYAIYQPLQQDLPVHRLAHPSPGTLSWPPPRTARLNQYQCHEIAHRDMLMAGRDMCHEYQHSVL